MSYYDSVFLLFEITTYLNNKMTPMTFLVMSPMINLVHITEVYYVSMYIK